MTNASPHLHEGMVIIHPPGEVSVSLNWVYTAQGEHRFVLNFSWIRFSILVGLKLWTMLLQPKECFFPLFSYNKSWASKMGWANCQLHLQMCTTTSGSKWFVSSAGMHFRFNFLLDIYLLIIQSTSEMIWLIFFFSVKISAVLLLNAYCSAFSRNRLRLSVLTNAFWGDKLGNLLVCEFSVHLLLEYLPACQSVRPKGALHCLQLPGFGNT